MCCCCATLLLLRSSFFLLSLPLEPPPPLLCYPDLRFFLFVPPNSRLFRHSYINSSSSNSSRSSSSTGRNMYTLYFFLFSLCLFVLFWIPSGADKRGEDTEGSRVQSRQQCSWLSTIEVLHSKLSVVTVPTPAGGFICLVLLFCFVFVCVPRGDCAQRHTLFCFSNLFNTVTSLRGTNR